jgi:hypothetical protein
MFKDIHSIRRFFFEKKFVAQRLEITIAKTAELLTDCAALCYAHYSNSAQSSLGKISLRLRQLKSNSQARNKRCSYRYSYARTILEMRRPHIKVVVFSSLRKRYGVHISFDMLVDVVLQLSDTWWCVKEMFKIVQKGPYDGSYLLFLLNDTHVNIMLTNEKKQGAGAGR